jgi:hypothetical protein
MALVVLAAGPDAEVVFRGGSRGSPRTAPRPWRGLSVEGSYVIDGTDVVPPRVATHFAFEAQERALKPKSETGPAGSTPPDP